MQQVTTIACIFSRITDRFYQVLGVYVYACPTDFSLPIRKNYEDMNFIIALKN